MRLWGLMCRIEYERNNGDTPDSPYPEIHGDYNAEQFKHTSSIGAFFDFAR